MPARLLGKKGIPIHHPRLQLEIHSRLQTEIHSRLQTEIHRLTLTTYQIQIQPVPFVVKTKQYLT